MTEYNTNKSNTINVSVFRTLWEGLRLWFSVYHPESTTVRRAPALTLLSMCSSLYLLTRAYCVWCSPSIPLWLASYLLAPAGGRTQSPDFALRIPVSHDQPRACLFFLLVHQIFELGVEVSFKHWSAITNHKVNLLKLPHRSSSFERTDDAFVLLICFCFFHL